MALSPSRASTRSWRPSGWMKVMVGIARPSGWSDGDGKAVEPAQRVVVAALWRARDLDGGHLARQRRQKRLAFEARDKLADAHMDARAKPDMAAGPAGHVIVVGIVPPPRIAVGGAEEHQHLFAL